MRIHDASVVRSSMKWCKTKLKITRRSESSRQDCFCDPIRSAVNLVQDSRCAQLPKWVSPLQEQSTPIPPTPAQVEPAPIPSKQPASMSFQSEISLLLEWSNLPEPAQSLIAHDVTSTYEVRVTIKKAKKLLRRMAREDKKERKEIIKQAQLKAAQRGCSDIDTALYKIANEYHSSRARGLDWDLSF